jgi:hypothetical protein
MSAPNLSVRVFEAASYMKQEQPVKLAAIQTRSNHEGESGNVSHIICTTSSQCTKSKLLCLFLSVDWSLNM